MEKDYDGYDGLRYELFETLIPAMLYKGTEKERDEFFGFLKQDGKTFIHDMYQTLCEDDGLPYPYENSDFEVRIFERGGVNILQILLPSYNPNISDILRAYFIFKIFVQKKICCAYHLNNYNNIIIVYRE